MKIWWKSSQPQVSEHWLIDWLIVFASCFWGSGSLFSIFTLIQWTDWGIKWGHSSSKICKMVLEFGGRWTFGGNLHNHKSVSIDWLIDWLIVFASCFWGSGSLFSIFTEVQWTDWGIKWGNSSSKINEMVLEFGGRWTFCGNLHNHKLVSVDWLIDCFRLLFLRIR